MVFGLWSCTYYHLTAHKRNSLESIVATKKKLISGRILRSNCLQSSGHNSNTWNYSLRANSAEFLAKKKGREMLQCQNSSWPWIPFFNLLPTWTTFFYSLSYSWISLSCGHRRPLALFRESGAYRIWWDGKLCTTTKHIVPQRMFLSVMVACFCHEFCAFILPHLEEWKEFFIAVVFFSQDEGDVI